MAYTNVATTEELSSTPSTPGTGKWKHYPKTDGKWYYLDDAGTEYEVALLTSGSGAPANATYITQTASSGLSNEQALGSLATGILKNTTTTGVLSIAAAGTDYLSPAGSETVTNKTVDADSNTITNIGSSEVKAELITGLTADASPAASDDYLMTYDASASALKKALISDIVSAASGVGLVSSINVVLDGGGSAITTGIKLDVEVPFACTINQVTMLADQSGSIVVDIWKDTYANFPPTDADSITASAVPTISTATKSQDATLTGWTTSISAGDILRFNVDSVTSITRCTLALKVTRT